ncbi:hypothetical protein SeMB42_g03719 [Synchytrium endobioticum]|uniref:Histone deacetylase n=1 Tax=Synchytrium endobioticum TaxID=286115 RepID=A0A507D4X5_9FUNG|nr:hypothetical protein SeMB42_g03719 [Synchytrium endobioticum]TPX47822.1 hypothetical protein SeLEV6574_g02449 [Synchytrium endobioticum]
MNGCEEQGGSKAATSKDFGHQSKHRRVGYLFSQELMNAADLLPANVGRSNLVHSLIHAYGLPGDMIPINPRPATLDQLLAFHDSGYLDCIASPTPQHLEEYGLEHDCPLFPSLPTYCSLVAGASITAAQQLVAGAVDIALNWDGGRHHAHRDRASGFCYVNDIVLAILELQKRYTQILYIDFDVHHCDGVESAFLYTKRVMTLSFHRCESAFFPGTGTEFDAGRGKGGNHAINVPLRKGLCGPSLLQLFHPISKAILARLKPDCIVLQLGADGVSGDPLDGGWNLDTHVLPSVVTEVVSWAKPTLILGGGGYHHANCARTWTLATASAIGRTIEDEIPDHDHLTMYTPDFLISAPSGNMVDENKPRLSEIVERVLAVLPPANSEAI